MGHLAAPRRPQGVGAHPAPLTSFPLQATLYKLPSTNYPLQTTLYKPQQGRNT